MTGYLLVDHRASPGLSEQEALAAGYDPKWCKEGKVFEADTLTCSHCNAVVVKNPLRTRDRGHCRHCDAYLCDTCAIKAHSSTEHTPFNKFIELTLKQASLGSPTNLLST